MRHEFSDDPICCHIWQCFLLFQGWLIFHCVCVCMSIFLSLFSFIHSPIGGHQRWLHITAIVNNAIMNMSVQIPLRDSTFSFIEYIFRSKMTESCHNSIFNFWGTSILSSIGTIPIYVSTNNVEEFQFCHILANTCSLSLLIAILMVWFWFAFPWLLLRLSSFLYAYQPFGCLL